MTVHPYPRVNDSPFFQPEHKCLSIRRVYRLLNAAETGELTPADEWVWEKSRLSKPTTARQQAEIYPTINLLLSISAPYCEWSLSTNITGGKRTECGHVSPPSLLLCLLLKVSSVSRQTNSGVAVIYVSAPSVFPDLPWILFCGAAPQLWVSLRSLMLCQLLICEAAYFSPSHYNLSGFALYPLNVSRHLQVPYIPRQNNSFATIWG